MLFMLTPVFHAEIIIDKKKKKKKLAYEPLSLYYNIVLPEKFKVLMVMKHYSQTFTRKCIPMVAVHLYLHKGVISGKS